MSQNTKQTIIFMVVLLIGFSIRVAILLPNVEIRGDAEIRYDPIARNLVAGNGFSEKLVEPFEPDGFDQPGYPYFVAAIYWLFNGSKKAVVIIQLLLELGTLAFVICILHYLGYSRRVKLIALSIGFVFPFLPIFSGVILTEVLATFFVTLACCLLIKTTIRNNLASIFIAGLTCGICLLIRPDTIVVILFVTIATTIALWHHHKQKSFIKISIIYLIIIFTLLPWTIRNYYYFQALRPLGGITEQVGFAYSKWLDTWLDDPKYFETFWWQATDKEYSFEIPENKMPEDERIRAESALFLAKPQNSFEGEPNRQFITLTNEARQKRSLNTFIFTPLRRTIFTWVRMPTSIHQKYLRMLTYPFWIMLLLFTVIGMIIAVRSEQCYLFLILFAVVLGRTVLPLTSSLAIEPRYMLVTCTHKITPEGWRESTRIKIGDSSYEKDFYRRANRRHSERI